MTLATAMSVNPDAWGRGPDAESGNRIGGSWVDVANGRALERRIRTARSACVVRLGHRAASEGR